MKSPSDRGGRTAAWAVVLGAVVAILISFATGETNRRWLFDRWQNAAPRTIGTDKVAVVLIDSASLATVGSWPWPRYYLARLTEGIAAQQPRAIGFDIIFAEPDAHSPATFAQLYPELGSTASAQVQALPDMDALFAQVIAAAPVLLPRLGVPHGGVAAAELMVDPEVHGRPPAGTPRFTRLLTSIPKLDDVALAHALINGPPDADGLVRRVPLAIMAGNRPMPGLAVELARMASGVERLTWRGTVLDMGARRLPADEEGRLTPRLGRFPERAIYSADDVLTNRVPPQAFAGKVVLIGLGAEGTQDIVATPLGTEQFGVLVQAQAVDAILTGGWLARPRWLNSLEWLAGAVLVIIVVAGRTARRRRPFVIAGSLFALALPLASWLAFDRANLLLDPLRPLLIGLGAATALAVTQYIITRAERARLAASLTEQRVAAAAQEGELSAARRIQMGMVPSAERLAGLDPRVEIGAVLRPAFSVGGDFYDALKVGPDRLLFVIGDVTGKGVPAALYMALSKALAKSVLRRGADRLGEAVAALNRDLMAEADEEMGVTVLAGVLDCATGELAMVSAGHENPLVVRSSGEIDTLRLRGGPPLCVIDFPYAEEPARLEPGDTLVLITDGATEAANTDNALLGTEGVIEALRHEGEMPAAERAIDLAERVRAFEAGTEPSDDLTILTIRRF